MSEPTKCSRAIVAAMEIITESLGKECGGQYAEVGEKGMMIWVPNGELKYQPHGDHDEGVSLETMIKSCVESSWAKGLSRAMTTTPEAQEEVARKICSGLYD